MNKINKNLKIIPNFHDLGYIKREYGLNLVNEIKISENFIERNLFLKNKTEDILSGKLLENKTLIKENEEYTNYIFSPKISDKDEKLFLRYKIRNLTLYQNNCKYQTISLIVTKSIKIEDIKKEYFFIKKKIEKEILFIVDSKISKKKFLELIDFLKIENINFINLKWRGKSESTKKLLILKENNILIHISNLPTNLSIQEKKIGKRIVCSVALTLFRKNIVSISRGISMPPNFEKNYPIYVYDHQNWTIELTKFSSNINDYAKNRIELLNTINEYNSNYFTTINPDEFRTLLIEKGIILF